MVRKIILLTNNLTCGYPYVERLNESQFFSELDLNGEDLGVLYNEIKKCGGNPPLYVNREIFLRWCKENVSIVKAENESMGAGLDDVKKKVQKFTSLFPDNLRGVSFPLEGHIDISLEDLLRGEVTVSNQEIDRIYENFEDKPTIYLAIGNYEWSTKRYPGIFSMMEVERFENNTKLRISGGVVSRNDLEIILLTDGLEIELFGLGIVEKAIFINKYGGYILPIHIRKEVKKMVKNGKMSVEDYWNKLISCHQAINVDDSVIKNLSECDQIKLPNTIDLHVGLDVTIKDNIIVESDLNDDLDVNVLLVNGENRLVGVFEIVICFIDGEEEKWYLCADANKLWLKELKSSKFYFIFSDVNNSTFWKVPVEVNVYETEDTQAHLCIDFGTSNTTAGCYLEDDYVKKISNLSKINGNVTFGCENIVKFENIVDVETKEVKNKGKKAGVQFEKKQVKLEKIVPTIVYVDSCSDGQNIQYCHGFEAVNRIAGDEFCPKASCFLEIKRWTTSDLDNVKENITDVDGNKAEVTRADIIGAYFKYIIRTAENQFKCKFKNVHISAPVKLKSKVLNVYSGILEKLGYQLEIDNALDEGVAVLYSLIAEQIKNKRYEKGKEQRALLIDCGGGTSDLASCKYSIDEEDGVYDLEIETEYMNGDINFGGNNLTYRIMQYMKIAYVSFILNNVKTDIDDLITIDKENLFSFIESKGEKTTDVEAKTNYDVIYKKLNADYKEAEKILPTRFKDYENKTKEVYDKVMNNFYFLWNLAEAMKKEFYESTSVQRYGFNQKNSKKDGEDFDLHVNPITKWKLSVFEGNDLKEQKTPDIIFTSNEIDKLLRADIYYLVRKFLNQLYLNGGRQNNSCDGNSDGKTLSLSDYGLVQLSGQSSKIGIFMNAMKEFLPGRKITSDRKKAGLGDGEANELKLRCLRGAILYLHQLHTSNLEVNMKNAVKNVPVTVYWQNENGETKELIKEGENWQQKAGKVRITDAGKELYLYMRERDKKEGKPYKYHYSGLEFEKKDLNTITKLSGGTIDQDFVDHLPENRKYVAVFLDESNYGFNMLPMYKDKADIYVGEMAKCPFETDVLQEVFFDGRK